MSRLASVLERPSFDAVTALLMADVDIKGSTANSEQIEATARHILSLHIPGTPEIWFLAGGAKCEITARALARRLGSGVYVLDYSNEGTLDFRFGRKGSVRLPFHPPITGPIVLVTRYRHAQRILEGVGAKRSNDRLMLKTRVYPVKVDDHLQVHRSPLLTDAPELG
jgi:hypothetical protein